MIPRSAAFREKHTRMALDFGQPARICLPPIRNGPPASPVLLDASRGPGVVRDGGPIAGGDPTERHLA